MSPGYAHLILGQKVKVKVIQGHKMQNMFQAIEWPE